MGLLSSGKVILDDADIINYKKSQNKIKCTECQTILNGTCLVIMDHGEPIYYFCNKQCKKDYVRVNGMIK